MAVVEREPRLGIHPLRRSIRTRSTSARSAGSAATPRPTSGSCSPAGWSSPSDSGSSRRAWRPRCPAPGGRPPARNPCRPGS